MYGGIQESPQLGQRLPLCTSEESQSQPWGSAPSPNQAHFCQAADVPDGQSLFEPPHYLPSTYLLTYLSTYLGTTYLSNHCSAQGPQGVTPKSLNQAHFWRAAANAPDGHSRSLQLVIQEHKSATHGLKLKMASP